MKLEKATLGGGCFWCTEAIMQRIKGVDLIVSGYTGGTTKKPTYQDICTGKTGHAEVVQITYDADILSYQDLLIIFMATHDPTTLNQQGADKGTQYRSVVYYHNESQKKTIEEVIKHMQHLYEAPIVTEVCAMGEFYPAEDVHQNYYNNHPTQGYCRIVINPKIQSLKEKFADKLKD